MNENKIIKLAAKKGINQIVVNRIISNYESIKFENNSFVKNQSSLKDQFLLQAFIDGNKISKSIARPTEEDINNILDLIIEESKFKTKEVDEHPIDTSNQKYIKLDKKDFNPPSNQDAKKILQKLVKEINELDKRILVKNTFAVYSLVSSKETFVSTQGTNLTTEPSNNFSIMLGVLFDDQKGIKGQSYVGRILTHSKEFNIDDFKKEVLSDIKLQEQKKKIEPGNYEIVFDQNIFMKFLTPFLIHLNGRSVVDGISHWSKKIGKSVASEKINLVDKPILKDLGVYITYDEDGMPTTNQHFIKNGKLEKFLTNKKLAEILKVKNSHNANNNGAYFFNSIIEPGNSDEKEIINSVKKGIWLRDLSGMHSGINATSGEFSLELKGNLIENGKIKEDIIGAVISGNFFKDVLNNVKLVGNTINLQAMSSSPVISLSNKLPISS